MPSRDEFQNARKALAGALDVMAKSAETIEEAFLAVEAEKTGAAGSLAHIKKETEKGEAYLDELKRQIASANEAAGQARGEANEWRAQADRAKSDLADARKAIDEEKKAFAEFKAALLSKISG